MDHAVVHSIMPPHVPRSRSHEGRFGRLFGRGFSVWAPPGLNDSQRRSAISTFAKSMYASTTPPDSRVPAGYTYLGQFIDHDITFDPQSSLTRKNDPDGLQNFRTPRFDLDSVYGRGPDDQPYLYDARRGHDDGFAGFLKLGFGEHEGEPDLQRNQDGTAIIGDPRNDENVIVSQLQLTFCRLHNAVLEKLSASPSARTTPGRALFDEAQRITTWFYQYVVWNDFVRRIVAKPVFEKAISVSPNAGGGDSVSFGLSDVYNWSQTPFIPVEFSVAAYRFGHSMIRAEYQLNFNRQEGQIGPEKGLPIFAPPGANPPEDLRGGHPLKHRFSLQWDWFFTLPSSSPPFPQRAHRIDRHLSQSVFHIPEKIASQTHPLAELNISRGWAMELPPATEIATALNIEPLPIEDPFEESLWVYILKEAEVIGGGEQLGPVGGTIVAAVFSGLLRGDPKSYINRDPSWTPAAESVDGVPLFKPISVSEFGLTVDWQMADILKAAGMPLDIGDINALLGPNP